MKKINLRLLLISVLTSFFGVYMLYLSLTYDGQTFSIIDKLLMTLPVQIFIICAGIFSFISTVKKNKRLMIASLKILNFVWATMFLGFVARFISGTPSFTWALAILLMFDIGIELKELFKCG